ncbi:SIR2 family NAD-dependent protein deacylase [Pseudoduganella sp. R-43]|uniref:SIR2 family NAD-dependent protein deacylase n=1 Tax=Pseudoduganella sp. R-43 TaxID=3404063 RepID=UPI003CF5A2B6
MTIESQLAARAAELIDQADGLVIAAGAGIGVDSGLPDFRGNEGFWKAYPALGRARMEFTSVASPSTFRDDPALAWGFYGHRLKLYRETVPHEGFALLKAWGDAMDHGSFVFTSNVDGQFQKAGFDPRAIYECHGSIHHLQCLEPCCGKIWPADGFAPDVDADACRLRNEAPRCPDCGGLARPNILMFGDWGWVEHRSGMQAARLEAWLEKVLRPLVIELGAGTAIPSVRHFGHGVVQRGGRLVRINPREFAVGGAADVGIAAGALEGLRAIGREIQNR